MTHTLAKFSDAKYGNYENGHRGRPQIEGVNLLQPATGPEVNYLVSYDNTQYGGHLVKFNVPAHLIAAMRNWLVSEPIVGKVAQTYTEGEVLRRIEQYYGHNGLAEFMERVEAAYETISA